MKPPALLIAVLASIILPGGLTCHLPTSADDCPAPSFAAARSYPLNDGVFTSPATVAVGDFNGDGKPDFVVALSQNSSSTPGNVSVLLNKGDGTFGPGVNYGPAGVPGAYVAVGDFNGDGKLDLVIANYGSTNVSILSGRGDGTFGSATSYGVGVNPSSMVVGDFNRDGKLDIVAANSGSTNVSVLLGNGDGSFQSFASFAVNASPNSIAVGDFNRDGKLDLAVANAGATNVSILLGNGDGTFQAAANFLVGANPSSVAIGDFNRDGIPDLAVANQGSTNVSVLLGNGDGTLQTAINYTASANPTSVAVGDFNGDGRPDLAVANFESQGVAVLLGNGDGTFQSADDYGVGVNPLFVVTGDFDADGSTDLAVVNSFHPGQGGSLNVFLGRGNGTFPTPIRYPGPYWLGGRIATGDFNGDGHPDLAMPGLSNPNSIAVLLGRGDGSFQLPATNSLASGSMVVPVGDFNGDGKLDLVAMASPILMLLGNGDGTFQNPIEIPNEFVSEGPIQSATVGDFNHDGNLDLAAAYESGTISILLGKGDGTFGTATNFSGGASGYDIVAGDFNGDGKFDLAVANFYSSLPGSGSLAVLLGKGDGSFQAAATYAVGLYPWSVAAGDFNGDGKLDLVTADSYPPGYASVLLGNGDGTFQSAVSYNAGGLNSGSVAVGDFNNDGKLDLAIGHEEGVSILSGNGDGTFQSPVQFGTSGAPYSLAVADFNQDGAPDIAAPGLGIWILLNACVPVLPKLNVMHNASSVTISWPYPSTGFILQSTLNLRTTNWQPAAETPTTNNSQLEITVPLDQKYRYFRLQQP